MDKSNKIQNEVKQRAGSTTKHYCTYMNCTYDSLEEPASLLVCRNVATF